MAHMVVAPSSQEAQSGSWAKVLWEPSLAFTVSSMFSLSSVIFWNKYVNIFNSMLD